MKRRDFAIGAMIVGVVLLLGALFALRAMPVEAEPPRVIPTPIPATADVGPNWIMVTWVNTNTVTGTQTSNAFNLPSYSAADIQWVLKFTDSETVTCKLQFSNDNSNFADGVNIVAAASADACAMNQFNLFGRYTRVVCTPTTTNAYTVTVTGKVHR